MQNRSNYLFRVERILGVLVLWFLIPAVSLAQDHSGKGAVTGVVKDEKGNPMAWANVVVKGTAHGEITDNSGAYRIEKIPVGERVLRITLIGYESREVRITVREGQTATIPEVMLREQTEQLEGVTLEGDKTNRFANKKTEYVARMPLHNLENPQVYSIVGKDLIQEQIITDINETMRNVPGVVPLSYPSGGFAATFRGFTVGVNARNGMESLSSRSSLDIANVERIEVLKGPSGTLFGSNISSFGGVINLVTKRPMEAGRTELSYTTGSFNLHRLTADINTPLNEDKTVLFRLNAAVNREKSFQDFGFNNTFLIAPSLTYKASDRLTFNLDAEIYDVNNTRPTYNYYGANSGINGPQDIALGYRKSLFHEEFDAKSKSLKIFAEAKYILSENWTSTTLFSMVEEDLQHSYQGYATWISPTKAVRRMGDFGPINTYHTNIQENINGTFNTGKIRHKVLIGANYKWYNQNAVYTMSDDIDTVDVTTDFAALRKGGLAGVNINPRKFDNPNEYVLSGYVTDVVEFTDRFSTMLSLRVDHFKRDKAGAKDSYEQTSVAPKLGLVYQVVKDQVSVFGNYMSGFQNQEPRNQPDGSSLVLDPLYAVQYEGGIKAETFDNKLSATVSYYNITIDDAIRTGSDGFITQDGKQISKGVDVDIVANPVSGLNIVAGYAFNDNKIVRTSDPDIEGNKAVSSPEHVANFWASYTFQNHWRGLGIGVGGNYVSDNYRFSDNVFTIPSYTVLNATVFYNQPKWRVGLKLNNLTDEKYWSVWEMRQQPFNFAANLTLRF
ncbi:iron complex outermembrane recepter protein [Sinomicrobium oceani]|uniref:Iron complex outermembrane recepter protein n=1 Tax=Sinomicrobium oceani TaxID=1150368 RepID=A0A1K1NH49_9FLAO|nr:TonB-dependent receptor [Sinomicrobium oceani]SFW34639.1 iron complex outermembrane recepter protein [Sinomicrobium oceani]